MVMNVSEKILYITENAKNTPDNYDFYIKNKPEDWKSTLDFKWESSDETVATVANGGITQAVGVGVTTISCTITDKETGEEVAFTTCELTVKGIADRIEIINAPEDGIVGIGENVIDLNRAMYDEAGNRTTKRGVYVSDYTRWISSDETIATIDKNGVVTTYKEGEFTVTAETYQSKANPATNASTSITLTAQASMVSAAQKSATKAEVVFDTNMKDVITKDNLVVSSIVGTTPVKQIVKSVSFDETGKVATVEVYVDFATNTEYIFEYNNMKAGFVGADLSIENVASIVITTQTAKVNEETPIEVKLYDVNGIEIRNDGSRVTIESLTDIFGGYVDEDQKTIQFWESGASAQVKATFHTWEYSETGIENCIETVGTIVSVEEQSGVSSVVAYHIGKEAPGSWGTDDVEHRIASDYADRKIYIKAVAANGNELYNDPDSAELEEFTFESSDPTTLIVGSDGAVYPVKAGNVDIIVYYDDRIVAALPVTVISESTTVSLSYELSSSKISAYPGADDSITLTVSATDQLEESTIKENSDVKIEALGNEDSKGVLPRQEKPGTFIFETSDFSGLDFEDRTTYTYQYTVKVDNIVRTFSITAGYPTDIENPDYVITMPNEVNLAFNLADINKGTDYDFLTEFSIKSQGSNGFKIKDITEIAVNENEAKEKATNETPYFYFEVDSYVDNSAVSGAAIKLFAVSGSAITKASTGNLRVTAHMVTVEDDGETTDNVVHSTYMRVTDTQSAPAVTVLTNRVDDIYDVISNDVIKVVINGVNVSNNVEFDEVIGFDTTRPFIRTLAYNTKVTVNGDVYDYTFIIPVNQTFIVE